MCIQLTKYTTREVYSGGACAVTLVQDDEADEYVLCFGDPVNGRLRVPPMFPLDAGFEQFATSLTHLLIGSRCSGSDAERSRIADTVRVCAESLGFIL